MQVQGEDVTIFEIVLSTRDMDSYLVTGNIKYFPEVDFVVIPKEMMTYWIAWGNKLLAVPFRTLACE